VPAAWRWIIRSTRPRPRLDGPAQLDLEETLVDGPQLDPEEVRLSSQIDDPGRGAETSHASQGHRA